MEDRGARITAICGGAVVGARVHVGNARNAQAQAGPWSLVSLDDATSAKEKGGWLYEDRTY